MWPTAHSTHPWQPSFPQAIAVGAGGIWGVSVGAGTIAHIDASTGKLVSSGIEAGRDPAAIAVGVGGVWIANAGDCTVSRLQP